MDPATDCVWSSELGRWALDFDRSDDHITHSRQLLESVFTFACWLRVPATALPHNVLVSQGLSVIYTTTSLGTAAGKLRAFDGEEVLVSSIDIRDDTWRHVVLTGTASITTLYLDGSQDAQAANNMFWNATATHIGNRQIDGAYDMLASIADPLIYNRALTPSEIQQLADPSNVMLSGLILPPKRRLWAVTGGAAPPVFGGVNTILGGGVAA